MPITNISIFKPIKNRESPTTLFVGKFLCLTNKKGGNPISSFVKKVKFMKVIYRKYGVLYRMKMNLIIGLYYRLIRLR